MKQAEHFYEVQRAQGETEHITGNENPDYTLPFYQAIFRLMESYGKKHAHPDTEADGYVFCGKCGKLK